MNQVADRFGLGEVDSTVEKRALREFARLRQPRAVFQNCVQNDLGRKNAAVTGDFDNVLARERARRAHDREQNLIHDSSLPHNFTVMDRVRRRLGRLQRALAERHETLVRHGQRLRAGKTNHRQAAFTQGRRNRGNGVVEHRST